MNDLQNGLRAASVALWILLIVAATSWSSRLAVMHELNELRSLYLLQSELSGPYSAVLMFPCDPGAWTVEWSGGSDPEFHEEADTCELDWASTNKPLKTTFFETLKDLKVSKLRSDRVVAASEADGQLAPYETLDSLKMQLIGTDSVLIVALNPRTIIRHWLQPLSTTEIGDILLFFYRVSYNRGSFGDTPEQISRSVLWNLNIAKLTGPLVSSATFDDYNINIYGSPPTRIAVWAPQKLIEKARKLPSADFIFFDGVLRQNADASELFAFGKRDDNRKNESSTVRVTPERVDRAIKYELSRAGFASDSVDTSIETAIWKVQSQKLKVPGIDLEIDLTDAALAFIGLSTILGAWSYWNLISMYRMRATFSAERRKTVLFVDSFRLMRLLVRAKKPFNMMACLLLVMLNIVQAATLIIPLFISALSLKMIYLPPIIPPELSQDQVFFEIMDTSPSYGLSRLNLTLVILATTLQAVTAIGGLQCYAKLMRYGWSWHRNRRITG